jgi:hypothetical protein
VPLDVPAVIAEQIRLGTEVVGPPLDGSELVASTSAEEEA